jgi:hypothetical protein
VTGRDRIVVLVLAAAAVLGGFWFVILGPKRAEIKTQQTALTAAQDRLTTAEASASSAAAAKRRYASDYATVARLGKAMPVDDDTSELLYQLQAAAKVNKINFRVFALGTAPASTTTTTASSQTAAVSSANGSTPSAASTASSALPPGAVVGAAGFPTMPFNFTFDGSYFDMEHMLHSLDALTTVADDSIDVKGRLLTVDGFALSAGPKGFPQVTASLSATAYLLPADEGLTAGATAAAPAGTATTPTTSAAEISGSKR